MLLFLKTGFHILRKILGKLLELKKYCDIFHIIDKIKVSELYSCDSDSVEAHLYTIYSLLID